MGGGPHVGRRRRVGERPFGVVLGDGGGGDIDHLAVQRAEASEREGVDLDHRVLAGLDEADIEVGHQHLDLKLAADRRQHDELLARGDDLAHRGDGYLLNDAVRGRIEAGAGEARLRLGERLTPFIRAKFC